jgi:hypothetical protein
VRPVNELSPGVDARRHAGRCNSAEPRYRRPMRWLIAVGCATLLSPSTADACTCKRPVIEVWPLSTAALPLNAQIRITWSEGQQGSPSGDGAAITLVTSKGAEVATHRKSWISGAVHTLVLTPKKALAPQSDYLVKMPGTADRGVLDRFTTGTTSDDSPPTWKGIAETRYVDEPARCCNCSSGKPYAVIEIAEDSLALRDDQTAAEDLVFGVWPARGPVDSTTLLAIAPAWSGTIRLGEWSTCAPRNFTLPAARPARFRIAPIDLAGNVGTPAEITIDPSKPERQRL